MNIALIIAGGVGSRFGADIPKQFVEVNHKPIMAYTLETFEQSMEIDVIIVVCVASWEDYIDRLKSKFNITKLVYIIPINSFLINYFGKCIFPEIISERFESGFCIFY